MTRDTSDLYTGNIRTKREVEHQDKLEKKSQLTPATKVVFDLIEKEKKANGDISSLLVTAETSEENVKAILLAKQLYHNHLVRLQNIVSGIMRVKPTKDGE